MPEFRVPEERSEELEVVRDSGEANMFDRRAVQFVANKYGYYKLVVYLENNRDRYGEILRQFGEWKKGRVD